jgi:KTSC domain
MHIPATFRCRLIVAAALTMFSVAHSTNAETVLVNKRGKVDLTPFKCYDKTRSTFITRVCYDIRNRYMLIGFEDGTYNQYCRVPVSVANGLVSAASKGKFYNTKIRGDGRSGPFDCRTH